MKRIQAGEVRREVIEWPTGRTVGGGWTFEKPEAA